MNTPRPAPPRATDLICFSLEPWDDVWRRNQLLVTELLKLRADLRILFAELPIDVTWAVMHRHKVERAPLRPIGSTGRLWAFTPVKLLPRRVAPWTDRSLERQVLGAARRVGIQRPLLWINDVNYAALPQKTGWPAVYDVTDDWLLGDSQNREQLRIEHNDRLLLEQAHEVVVCSPALQATRGRNRHVHVITNAVDVEHLRRPQPRPDDLPAGRVVLYLGTMTEGRLDVDLCLAISKHLAGRATAVFVGPNAMTAESTARLRAAGALILGPRPYLDVPAYLQHADVLMVPHRVSPFTESLDPIKARELAAVGRPTVTTPVAGFRDAGPPFEVVGAEGFLAAVDRVLDGPTLPPGAGPLLDSPPTWAQRAGEFLDVLDAAVGATSSSGRAGGAPPGYLVPAADRPART